MGENLMFTVNLDELGAVLDNASASDNDIICAAAQIDEYRKLYDSSKNDALSGVTDLSAKVDMIMDKRGLTQEDVDTFAAMARAAEESDLTKGGVNLKRLAEYNDVREDLINKYAALSVSERESTVRFKSVLTTPVLGVSSDENETSVSRWDDVVSDKPLVLNEGLGTECTITRNEDGTLHCEGYLAAKGGFDYDPAEWAIGYKEIPGTESENPDGSLTKLPVFKYIGDVKADTGHAAAFEEGFHVLAGQNRNEQVKIPDGVRVLDYTFEGNDQLQLIPGLPDSVESAHCCFRDCTRIHGASHQLKRGESFLNSGGSWDLPDNFQDASYMFSNCHELGNTSIGKLNSNILTIEGMFANSPQALDEQFRNGFELFWVGPFSGSKDMDYSECPYLMREFANPLAGEEGSNQMKRIYEREEKERRAFQESTDWSAVDEETQEKHDDAKAANAVRLVEKVMGKDDLVGQRTDLALDLPSNQMGEFIQKGVVDVGSYLGISTIVGGVTNSKLLGFVSGVGGTFLLRNTGILPTTIEPALNWIKDKLPEGTGKDMLGKIIDHIHVPTAEEIAKAEADRTKRFASYALDNVYSRAIDASASMDLDESMTVQGNNMMMRGVYETVANNGSYGQDLEDLKAVTHSGILSIEDMFDRNAQTYSNAGMQEQMRETYLNLLDGFAALNNGAIDAIPQVYDASDTDAVQNAVTGISIVNQTSVEEVMDSLIRYDKEYHFMREEDWKHLDELGMTGIGKLSEFESGNWIIEPEMPQSAADMQADRVDVESPAVDTVGRHAQIMSDVNNLAVNQVSEEASDLGLDAGD